MADPKNSRNRQTPMKGQVSTERLRMEHKEVHWNYPVPPPELLERYNVISPEIASQFAKQWELEANHRRSCEAEQLRQADYELKTQRRDVTLSHVDSIIAVVASFALILTLLLATFYFANHGQNLHAIVALLGVLSLFWIRRKKQ